MKKKSSRLTRNLIEMGEDLRELGLIDEKTYERTTMRLLKKEKKVLKMESLTSSEIRAIRQREHLSQAVFKILHKLRLAITRFSCTQLLVFRADPEGISLCQNQDLSYL